VSAKTLAMLALGPPSGPWDPVVRLDVVSLSTGIVVVVDVAVVWPLGVERRNLGHVASPGSIAASITSAAAQSQQQLGHSSSTEKGHFPT
jgi:hypothetical protein